MRAITAAQPMTHITVEDMRREAQEQPTEADDWGVFEEFAGAWSGKFNREECYDCLSLR